MKMKDIKQLIEDDTEKSLMVNVYDFLRVNFSPFFLHLSQINLYDYYSGKHEYQQLKVNYLNAHV